MQQFTTKMSPLVLVLTLSIHLFVVVATVCSFRQMAPLEAGLVSLLLFAVFVPAFVLRPFRYEIANEVLVIRKHMLPRYVPLDTIASVEPVEYAALKITIRLWASGGLWGWYGIFLSSKYGRLNLQCTELKHLVMVTLQDGKKIVLSPADPEAFLAALAKFRV